MAGELLQARLDMAALLARIGRADTPTALIEDIDALTASVVTESRPGEDVILAMSGRNFHGIHDTEIPMDGSESDDGYLYVPVNVTMQRFAEVNGCWW